jgi:hypothetical protein
MDGMFHAGSSWDSELPDEEVQESQPQYCYPALKSLSISTHLLPVLPSFSNAPKLTSLRLEANTVSPDATCAKLPLHQIKHIRIERPYSSGFLRWLSHTPNVESVTVLSATRLKLAISPRDLSELNLPHLRHLDIQGLGCQPAYAVISSSALSDLTLSAGTSISGAHALVTRSREALTSLTLRDIRAGTCDEFRRLLKDAPHLNSLAVELAMPQPEQAHQIASFLSALVYEPRGELCPRLQDLSIYVEGLSTTPVLEFGPTLVKVHQSRKSSSEITGACNSLERVRLLFQVSDGIFSSVRQMRLHADQMLRLGASAAGEAGASGNWLDSVRSLTENGCRVETTLVGQVRVKDRWQTTYHQVNFDPSA